MKRQRKNPVEYRKVMLKNISGRKINVLCQPMEPNEVKEFSIPKPNQGEQSTELYITTKRDEYENLIEHEYVEDVTPQA